MSMSTMCCPVCGVSLTMSERQNVEIDYCPQCRGIWLDRGELDKILERAAREAALSAPPPQPQPRGQTHAPPQQPHYGHDDRYRHKRKKSFLEELFD